jgi:hypothetical protein
VFWKEILKLVEHRESSGRAAETSGRKQARVDSKLLDTEEGPDEMFSLSGRMMLWTVGHPDGMTRRPDGWQGTEFSDLQTVQNLLEAF